MKEILIGRKEEIALLEKVKYAEELRNKIGLFREITETNKSVYLTFITTFGLEPNEYAAALVQNSFTIDVLFEAV